MNIKLRLSLQFMLIVAGILVFFSILLYYFSYSGQVSKFRQSLFETARNSATLLITVDEVDSSLLKKIHSSIISGDKEELVLTDSAFNVIYSYNSQYLSDINVIVGYASDDLNFFSITGKDGVFYRYHFNDSVYFVYAMAFDITRDSSLRELRKILFWSILISIVLAAAFSYLFANRAMKPISNIIRGVKEINSQQLSNRLPEGNEKDEIGQLSRTFNKMLSDLEVAFRNQEDFVSNASHELRTPLTVMIGESDYILTHEWEKEEYAAHLSGLIRDLRNMNSLVNSLLELAQTNRNRNIGISDIRIDEIVFTAVKQVKQNYPERKILPKIKYPEDGRELIVTGNSGMLEIAIRNLIDNACKFSDKEVGVEFIIEDEHIHILISDSGIGIPDNEIESISMPFKRASNVKFIGGYGIGLSLVSRIIELHDAELNITSELNKGSRFELTFRRSAG
jgi:signal transduction histidine kinase